MSRKHKVLHSTERHNNRNYKRRLRNLFLEIAFITILIFVAIKFVNRDNQPPKVSGLSKEEQQMIINNEMKQQDSDIQENSKEIKVLEKNICGIQIVKAILNYDKINNQTIINLDIKNGGERIEDAKFLLALVDKNSKTLKKTYATVQYLEKNQQTRINLVLDGDLTETEIIESREEN